ncbi:MAG: hypothetical protein JWP89_5660 [Schlesneria sp.]|nr:hypothetical protein [Schlesneria sp.]
MMRKVCLFGLIAITTVVMPPSAFYLVAGTCGIVYDLLHEPPPNKYPTLPSLAPAFVFGALVFLVPLACLWWLYFATNKEK